MSGAVSRVLVLGGGSAGWLTAGVIAARHRGVLSVTVVESPDIPTIGVGEGTWPSMRETLRSIGLPESRFLRECDASFKQGSKFIAWRNGRDDDHYYHPFSLPQGFFDRDFASLWHAHSAELSFEQFATPQVQVCEANLAPKQATTPDYASVVNYGYHLDAGKFGELLRSHCTGKLGVKHILDRVQQVVSREDGSIQGLNCQHSGVLEADLFIDCSGSGSFLMGRHFDIPFVSRAPQLFNDRALAVQVPYAEPDQAIASATLSTARSAGWIWDIGLPTRRGVGYVYSSGHSSDEQAELELRAYLKPLMGPAAAQSAELRQLRFEPGHRETFWYKNCVAIGMAAGFIEPLEASALALVEVAAATISDDFPYDRAMMDSAARRFNEGFSYRWERVIDFLKLHYVLSGRSDSDYWLDHRNESGIPDRLRELLEWWKFQMPSRRDFSRSDEIFTAASYQYVLYGMGFRTEHLGAMSAGDKLDKKQSHSEELALQARRLLEGLPDNRTLLQQLA